MLTPDAEQRTGRQASVIMGLRATCNGFFEPTVRQKQSAEFFTCLSSTGSDTRIHLLSEQHISSSSPEQPTAAGPAA
jgi:hypothetical protein